MSAAVIILRRRKYIRRFREKGATSHDQAITFAEVRMRRSWIFEQMINRGVFVPAGSDRYYLDERAAQTFLAAQRRRVWKAAGVLLLLLVIVLLLSGRW